MLTIHSASPRLELKEFIRAYAQREVDSRLIDISQPFTASLEQVVEFDFGDPPIADYYNGKCLSAGRISVAGHQTYPPGRMRFRGYVESFAIFFRPFGLWQLFGLPPNEITNQIYDGFDLLGRDAQELWHKMAENPSFEKRVQIIEDNLFRRMTAGIAPTPMMRAAIDIFQRRGEIRIDRAAERSTLSIRQFERKFLAEVGVHPKLFARVTRFQMALDAKVAAPDRTWLNIAHELGYHDQQHMIGDFHVFGLGTPTALVSELGHQRPPALAADNASSSESRPRT